LHHLAARLQGTLITASDAEYERARRVFNARIDRHPLAIAEVACESDVLACVRHAREYGLKLTVRSGGGHSPCGFSVRDAALVLDLSGLRAVRVDPRARTATVGGGACWGACDAATTQLGLATTGGAVSMVGVAGLTLVGGWNFLSRRHGLACDNLLSARLITAQGQTLEVNRDSHPDLFWALRGGGAGRLGVVTELELRLHPMPEAVLAGQLVWPVESARAVLSAFAEYFRHAPRELSFYASLVRSEGAAYLVLCGMYLGPVKDGEQAAATMKSWAPPLSVELAPQRYTAFKEALTQEIKRGQKSYWKTGLVAAPPDPALFDAAVKAFLRCPRSDSMINFEVINGAVHDTPAHETAFCHRNQHLCCSIIGVYDADRTPAEEADLLSWVRATHKALFPFMSGGVYPGYVDEELTDWGVAHYGENFSRLAAVWQSYDPDGLLVSGYARPPA
jgi:FAD/FMN-containing dehydrogenase